jgi:hypothetical protein
MGIMTLSLPNVIAALNLRLVPNLSLSLLPLSISVGMSYNDVSVR